MRDNFMLIRLVHQPAKSCFPVFTDVERAVVYIHCNEPVIQVLRDPPAKLARVF